MAKKELGVCILCGNETQGMPAREDFIVSFFRKVRAILRMPARHTVACSACLQQCMEKRAAFEKKADGYRVYAVLFFLLVVLGGLLYGNASIFLIVPALLGSIIIFALPYAYYCPDFRGKTASKGL
ncbi:Uncharacterised protein [uncultured archaeon]|nr:Uncharacterised protein [uncultured archaeon]